MPARTTVADPPDRAATHHARDHAHSRVHGDATAPVQPAAGGPAARPHAAGEPAAAGASGARLGNPANNAATAGHEHYGDHQWRRSRAGRFEARRWLRQITNLGRVAWCGKCSRQADGTVSLKLSEGANGTAKAGLGGVTTCGSLWACPACSAKITGKRTTEIERALEWNANRGGSVALLTQTMRHHKGQSLQELWDSLSTAWRGMTESRAWKTERKELGLDHYIRATEVTVGENGWHVHAHILLLFDGPVSEELVDAFGDRLYGYWSRALEKVGLEASREHGVDVRVGQGALDGLGKYLSKLTYEAAGGRWKSGRKGGRTPFEVLHDALETGLESDFKLWWEWEKASKGRRQLTWSRELKALSQVEEQTDEEIAAEDDGGDTIAILPKATWKVVEPQVVELLETAERWGAAGAYIWLNSRGLRWRLPDEEPQSADLWPD